jgi:hypothetical protein
MKILKRPVTTSLAFVLIASGMFLLSRCVSDDDKKQDVSFSDFAGSQTCAHCHKDIYSKHMLTEHHLSSMPASENNILGSFKEGLNVFYYSPVTKVQMEKRDSGLYQVKYEMGQETKAKRFDITVGSGRKGQSYLSWIRNSLIQMPISYFSPESTWSVSPGFSPNKVIFNRVVTSRCLECHSTYFQITKSEPQKPEEFDHNRIIYGIDCEKCHGPAAKHVEFQTKNPTEKQAKFIINTGKLARQLNLDMCILCHGGPLNKTKPSFSYMPGQLLSTSFEAYNAPTNPDNIDMHGNQFGLLSLSKCFQLSEMTCLSCHNVHENEKGKLELFSARCIKCHGDNHSRQCKLSSLIGPDIKKNCIDCHMPKQPSHAVAVFLQGASIPTAALMRNHQIRIYQSESDKVLQYMKSLKNTPANNR